MGWWHELQYLPVKTTNKLVHEARVCVWWKTRECRLSWNETLIPPPPTTLVITSSPRLSFPSPFLPMASVHYHCIQCTSTHKHWQVMSETFGNWIFFLSFVIFLCEPLFLDELNDEPNEMWEKERKNAFFSYSFISLNEETFSCIAILMLSSDSRVSEKDGCNMSVFYC